MSLETLTPKTIIQEPKQGSLLSVYRQVTQDLMSDFRVAAEAILGSAQRKDGAYEQGTDADEERMGMRGYLTIDLERDEEGVLIATVDSWFQHGDGPRSEDRRAFVIQADVAQAVDLMLTGVSEATILESGELDDTQRMTAVVDNLTVLLRQSPDPSHKFLAEQLHQNSLRRYVHMMDAYSQHIPMNELMVESDRVQFEALRESLNM